MRNVRVAVVLFASLLLAGCGVRFQDKDPGTEFFTSIEITGTMVARAPLTVLVEYEQFYPVDVPFHCELRRKKDIIKRIGEYAAPPLDGGSPEDTPVAGSIAFDFTVDEPGTFIVECLTERDEDNFIGDEIVVGSGDDAS